MRDDEEQDVQTEQAFKSSLVLVCFGLFLLAFLIAIDRPHWFRLRPMAGVAQALSLAGEPNAVRRDAGHPDHRI